MPRRNRPETSPYSSAPLFDWCPACRAARDRAMSADHDFDRVAAADPANHPGHRDATGAEWREYVLEAAGPPTAPAP